MDKPLCLIIMPFGEQRDDSGNIINFDIIYQNLIFPAIVQAQMEPFRADEEITGGYLNAEMYERLIYTEYAVVDLTIANAYTFYELGIRHAARKSATIFTFSSNSRIPFDTLPLKTVSYNLKGTGCISNESEAMELLISQLIAAKKIKDTDSPFFLLNPELMSPEIDKSKVGLFAKRMNYLNLIKDKLADARTKGAKEIYSVETLATQNFSGQSGAIFDIFLGYRSILAWKEMIRVAKKMPVPLAATALVQEQLALALNQLGKSKKSERILRELIEYKGSSGESFTLLGQVYKDRWEEGLRQGYKPEDLEELLRYAIESYLKGFNSDWRFAFPGINAIILMELASPPDPRREELIPVVVYIVKQRIKRKTPDFWDYATLMELAVIEKNEKKARDYTAFALATPWESWEPQTASRTLRMIREFRMLRREEVEWAYEIEQALNDL